MGKQSYPPIGDYGYIGDCHSAALISRSCSIDWCCVPRPDSPGCFGRLLDFAWTWRRLGNKPDEDYGDFLVDVINATVKNWHSPDQGIWEMRGAPRHFVQSKAMCWSALDRGIRLAEKPDREAPVEKWTEAREAVRRAIKEKPYER